MRRSALRPGHSEILLQVQPAVLGTPLASVCEPTSGALTESCPHEAWLTLQLDEHFWDTYDKFTFRISWPASVRIALPLVSNSPFIVRRAGIVTGGLFHSDILTGTTCKADGGTRAAWHDTREVRPNSRGGHRSAHAVVHGLPT